MVSLVSGVWPGEGHLGQELETAGHRNGELAAPLVYRVNPGVRQVQFLLARTGTARYHANK